MDPEYIITFTNVLLLHHEFGRALEVLEEYLGVIESTWGTPKQGKAYGIIGESYFGSDD